MSNESVLDIAAKKISSLYSARELRSYLFDYDLMIDSMKKRKPSKDFHKNIMYFLNLRLLTATALFLKTKDYRFKFDLNVADDE